MHQIDDKSSEPDPCQTRANMGTEAVPNEIPNDRDMPTELVPNEIEYDHRVYSIVYQMSSQESVERTTKRWSRRSHSDGYHCRRTSHGDREDYREPFHTKRLTETVTEWRTEGSKNYCRAAYPTECQTTLPEAYQMRTKMATGRRGPPRPYQMPNQEMPESAYAKPLSKSRSALLLRWVWPPSVKLTC